jgi:pimeloyl-ACP methyl ester carboxylesterase
MNLHYRTLGQGNPFIILHGLFGSSDNWQTIAKKLSESYTVILVDLRNHGHSPHAEDWNYEVMSKDVEALVSSLPYSEFILMGHSMGGKVAMKFACEHEGLLSHLIVVDIAPKKYKVHQREIVDALKSIDLNTISSRKEVEEILSGSIPDLSTRQFLLKNLYWVADNKLGWRFNLDVIDRNLEVVSEGIGVNHSCKVPSLFIRGSESGYIKDTDIDKINELFPASEVKTVEGAGHWVHAEKPQELLSLVEAFISS